MKYLSVCSGIEAASVAWHPLGWTPFAFAEIERFPSEVLAHHYGSNLPGEPLSGNAPPNLGDMTKFQEWPDAAIDVLVGGTPCQSFSVAGLRKGLADPRGNLALTYLAIADRYRSRWMVWENVPGVLSSNGGRDFGAFLGGLGELGYGWAYRVLDAQYVRVDGFGRAVPQRRRRVFVVGCLGDWRRAGAVLFESESLSGHSAPRREAREGVAADVAPSLTASGRGVERPGETRGQDPVVAVAPTLRAGGNQTGGDRPYGTDVDTCDSLLVTRGVAATLTRGAESGYAGRRQEDDDNLVASVAGTLKASPGRRNMVGVEEASVGLLVAHTLRAEGFDASEDGTGRGIPLVPFAFAQNTRDEVRLFGGDGQVVGALAAEPGMKQTSYVAHASVIAIQERAVSENVEAGPQGKGWQEGVGYTLEARHHVQAIASGWAVRRLTPTECERLQGFPDGYTAIPRGGKAAADGPRYKALGNSMAVNAMRWIGRRIEMVEALEREITKGKAA